MTKEQASFCKKLSDENKKTLSDRVKQVFKTGKFFNIPGMVKELSSAEAREGCLQGNSGMCLIFKMLGGEINNTNEV